MLNKPLIIVGMHRSGTSLTGQWLSACGLNLGDRLLDANHSNKKGHHEDLDFLNFHKEALTAHAKSKKGLDPDINIKLSDDAYFAAKGRSIINFKSELRSAWGWKEPRTCLFLDFYHTIMPDAKVIVVYREPEEVVDSLIRRDFKRIITRSKKLPFFRKLLVNLRKKKIFNQIKKRETEYLKTWNLYNEKVLSYLSQKKKADFLVVSLNEFAKHDKQIFDYITGVWKFPLSYTPYHEVFEEKLLKSAEDKGSTTSSIRDQQSEKILDQLLRYEERSLQLLHTFPDNQRAYINSEALN